MPQSLVPFRQGEKENPFCYSGCPQEGAINQSQTCKAYTSSTIILKVRGKIPASFDEDNLLMWL